MAELILSVHAVRHDAVAAVFKDYALRAGVQLERLTRQKGGGRFHPDLAIDEVPSRGRCAQ
jgi:predicted NodU family carbamoyl transferase